jgi:predicted ATPase
LQARQLAERHNYVLWEAMSSIVLGAVRVARGDTPAGLNDFENAGRILTEMEYILWQPFYLTEIGHGHACAGALDIAFERFDEALVMVARTEEYFWAPEIYRRKAIWLLRTDNPEAAEKAWIQAIDVASQHNHRAGALRAATDLAQHWISIDRASDAHELLHPIHAVFEEGFDTVDLADAKSALDSAANIGY